jgi:hypothetical protein
VSRDALSSGRIPTWRARSAVLAARFAERTDTKVAIARTRVPPAVASEETTTQSTIARAYALGGVVILVRVTSPGQDRELLAEEDRLWEELHDLVDSLPEDKVAEPGYFAEGWSAKDLVAHIGSWLAEAGVVLERIRFNTYRPEEIDVDAMNETFYASMHDARFPDVRAQAITARNRMLRAWRSLPERSTEADRWIGKAGPEHYAEHLPRLREWVDGLGRSRDP